MGFITKVDFTRQVKQGPGEIAVLSGSTTILGNLDVYGMIMSGGTDISTLWGGASSGTNKFVTGGTLDGSYDLTLGYNDGGSATPISLSALSDNVIVKYVTDETELLLAFTEFNLAGIGGVVKMGADIDLSGNQILDFGSGIELWGSNRFLNATASNFTVTLRGDKFVIKDVIFNGRLKNLDPTSGTATDTTNMIIFDDASTSFVSLQNCTFSNLVGSTQVTAVGYVIDIQDTSTDVTFSFSGIKVASGSDATKPYQPFRIQYTVGSMKGSLRVQFKDWVCYGIAPDYDGLRWQESKDAMVMRIDGSIQPQYKYGFFYDESVTWDIASELASTPSQWLDLFPTFWGPTTKNLSVDPTVTNTFGNPGDILITGTSAYMKVGSVTSNAAGDGDTDWILY